MIQYLAALLAGDDGGPRPLINRSGRWPAVRAAHLKREPACRSCGTRSNLQVHHVEPVHERPDLELDMGNLITLCEGPGGGCHLLVGHLKLWKSKNPQVRSLCDTIADLVRHRP